MTDREDVQPVPDEATALRIRRLELDLDDWRAENARLKASIARAQEEIMRRGESEAARVAEIADVRRALAAKSGLMWPARSALRRLTSKRK